MAEYIRSHCCKGTIRAICEDYRAGAGIDLEMDEADEKVDRKIKAPVMALWGAKGTVGQLWTSWPPGAPRRRGRWREGPAHVGT
jgi:haloacetate dehalogenase